MKTDLVRALKLTLAYVLVGAAWIVFSDDAIDWMTQDPVVMSRLQTWKGMAFIVVTGMLVFMLSWRALALQSGLIERLEHYAYRHKLTGLPNRRLAEIRLDEELTRALDSRCGLGVISIDLDHFGDINDSFGQVIGNDLLKQVAERLDRSFSDCAFVAHPSADEFMLIVPRLRSRDELGGLADRIHRELAEPFSAHGVASVYLSACIGAAHCPNDASEPAQLLRYADAALARAKHLGAQTFCQFEPELVERARRLVELDARLHRALEGSEIVMHYQPIVSGEGLERVGYEALMRWHPEDGDPIAPSEFIPAAEKSGMIVELGAWAIDTVCRQLAEWQREGLDELSVSVNLSARQFATGQLSSEVQTSLERHGVRPSLLNLEITESLLMEQGRPAQIALDDLHQLGVKLSLDDFGTGYSSLAYLKTLPVDTLKIDRVFIDAIESSRRDRGVVEAVLSMARIFGLTVVAEGVETEGQLAVLRELGCDRFQGFLLGRPAPAEAVVRQSDQ